MKKALTVLAVCLLLVLFISWHVNGIIDREECIPPAEGAPGDHVVLDGYRMNYRLFGTETAGMSPVLLVHGFDVRGGATWASLVSGMNSRRLLIVPDLPGFGHSGRFTGPSSACTHRGQASHLVALLDELGIEKVNVIGTSYGGGIACQMAIAYPGRVDSLVIIDGQCYRFGGGIFSLLGRLPLGTGRALTWCTLGAGPLGTRWASDDESPEYRARLARTEGTTDSFLAINDTPIDADIPSDLGKITCPTLIIWGENDKVIDSVEAIRLQQDINNAGLVILDDCGHQPYEDDPAAVNELISEFLETRRN